MLLIYLNMIESEEDQRKFSRLYNSYKYTMMYAASQVLKDQYLAEDAVHQAFLKVINNLSKIDESIPERTKSFLTIITKNEAKDIYCQHYGKKDDESDIPFEDLDEFGSTYHQPSVESQVMEDYNMERLVQIILSLPERYSDVLRLRYVHGLSDRKIAELLEVPYETIRKRGQRAKQLLEKAIDEQEAQAYAT